MALFFPGVEAQAQSIEKHHGRLETRKLWALPVSPQQVGFCAAAQVVRIHRHFLYLRCGKETQETVLYITSHCPLADQNRNAEALLDMARKHWVIENGNHYVRDRSYDEDRCQVRDPNSAQILATLRSMARFLAKNGAHDPQNPHQDTTPGLHRFCNANRNKAIGWLISARTPF